MIVLGFYCRVKVIITIFDQRHFRSTIICLVKSINSVIKKIGFSQPDHKKLYSESVMQDAGYVHNNITGVDNIYDLIGW